MRYYNPTLGRFINKDPIEEAGGLSLFGFCGNDGINGSDLLGLFDELGFQQYLYSGGGFDAGKKDPQPQPTEPPDDSPPVIPPQVAPVGGSNYVMTVIWTRYPGAADSGIGLAPDDAHGHFVYIPRGNISGPPSIDGGSAPLDSRMTPNFSRGPSRPPSTNRAPGNGIPSNWSFTKYMGGVYNYNVNRFNNLISPALQVLQGISYDIDHILYDTLGLNPALTQAVVFELGTKVPEISFPPAAETANAPETLETLLEARNAALNSLNAAENAESTTLQALKQAEQDLVQTGKKYGEVSIDVERAAQNYDAALESAEIAGGGSDLARLNWKAAHQAVINFGL